MADKFLPRLRCKHPSRALLIEQTVTAVRYHVWAPVGFLSGEGKDEWPHATRG